MLKIDRLQQDANGLKPSLRQQRLTKQLLGKLDVKPIRVYILTNNSTHIVSELYKNQIF